MKILYHRHVMWFHLLFFISVDRLDWSFLIHLPFFPFRGPKLPFMELQEQLKEIKKQLRLSMNGVVSQSMREKGLVYKLNFGVELPRIKSIATGFEKDHALAQALWKEDIRECKIMAALLQPIDSFFQEIADIWVEDIHNVEIAELTCMNLFQNLPYAPAKSLQ